VLKLLRRDFEGATYGLKFNKELPFGWRVTAEGADAAMSDERREMCENSCRRISSGPGAAFFAVVCD